MTQQYQMPGMDPLAGLELAPIFEKGVYIQNGTYKLEFQRCLLKMTNDVGLAFIVEFKFLESNHPAHQIGTPGTWFQKMSSKSANSAINAWYASQLGYDTSPAALAHFDANIRPRIKELILGVVGNAAALSQHRTVGLRVATIKTKGNKDFNLHTFSPWTPPQGWQPQPTPAVPAETQAPPRQLMPPTSPMQGGYPAAPYGAPAGQQFGQPQMQGGYPTAPPQQAPNPYGQPQQQQGGYPPAAAPYGAPAMPPAGPSPYGQPQQAPNPYGQPPQQAPAPGPFGPPGPPNQGGWPPR